MRQNCTCTHDSYHTTFTGHGGMKRYGHCFGCGATWEESDEGLQARISPPPQPLIMPLPTRQLRTSDWLERWPSITPETVAKHDWYVSELHGLEYLIMPVVREGTPVFYSARALDPTASKKYLHASGQKKQYWLSDEGLVRDPIFICEGVADAAALAQHSSSVALMGINYDGSLDRLLKNREVIIALDGDAAGMLASTLLATLVASVTPSLYIFTGEKEDPTHWSRETIEILLHLPWGNA